MATPGSGLSLPIAEMSAALLAQRELEPRGRVIAQTIHHLLTDAAVVVYVVERQGAEDSRCWKPIAHEGVIELLEPSIPFTYGTLGALAEVKHVLHFEEENLAREEYAHLNLRRSFRSIAYVPMLVEDLLVGSVEIVSYSQPLDDDSLAPVAELADVGTVSIFSAVEYQHERQSLLESLTRMTSLYELQVAFGSTLEMDALAKIITSKVQDLMGVQAVNLWLLDGTEVLLLMHRTGEDPSYEAGTEIPANSGIPGMVVDSGEGIFINDENDERLKARAADGAENRPTSIAAVAMIHEGAAVGVLEAINKFDGTPFDDTDVYLLHTIGEAAASSLNNASLYNAEKKVQILHTLVRVSAEITSTLNLDRVLQTIVNGAQAIIPYDRAAIALETRGKFQLKAVSSMKEINRGDVEVERLREVLEWASTLDEPLYVNQKDGEVDARREETRAKFSGYFAAAGTASIYTLPLEDDQGRVGILSLESSQPEFLEDAHFEILKVLAAQATVALRNAELYREVPFIGLLEPIIHKKSKFLAMEKRKRKTLIGLAAAVAIFLAVFPLPMRVAGNANVLPARTAQVQPKVDGVVKSVYVREGDPVKQGTILADLESWEYKAALAGAQAKYAAAVSARNEALARNDGATAGVKGIEADYWSSEVTRAKERLEQTYIRSSIDGVVATPHIENMVGKRLEHGDAFAEVVDTSSAMVDVAIDESDLPLLHSGARTRVKLDGFPTKTFSGQVVVLSPRGAADGDSRLFFARVLVPNADGLVRPGMQGRGKVSAGWHSAGYVLFRGPAMWGWEKLWKWFGW